MELSIHFDLVQVLGIAVLAWLAGNVGSLVGIALAGTKIPSREGQRFWTVVGMLSTMIPLQIPKLVVAAIGTGIAIFIVPAHAILTAAIITFALGALVMVLIGRNQRD